MSDSAEVISLYGDPVFSEATEMGQEAPPNFNALASANSLTDRIYSGETQGVGIVEIGKGGEARFTLAGTIGGFSMLGAADAMCDDIRAIMRGDDLDE